jgi:hypothetical protein
MDITKILKDGIQSDVLTEDVMQKIEVEFQLAVQESVNAKLDAEKTALKEEYASALESLKEEHNKQLDKYLQYVAEEFVSENAVQMKNNCKVELAESFLSGLKSLFESHNINISEENADVVSALEKKSEEIEKKLNDEMNKVADLTEEIEEHKKAITFIEATKDLTELEKEKVHEMMEGIVVSNVEDFAKKLAIVLGRITSVKVTEEKKMERATEIVQESNNANELVKLLGIS